jgi:hypothetical protein
MRVSGWSKVAIAAGARMTIPSLRISGISWRGIRNKGNRQEILGFNFSQPELGRKKNASNR